MAKKKTTPIRRVPKVLKEEAKKEEAEVTAAEAQRVVDELTAKQEEANKLEQKLIAQNFEHDPAVNLRPYHDTRYTMDLTEIPEFYEVPGEGRRRIKEPHMAYRWGRHGKSVQGDKLPGHHARGWRPVPYAPRFTGTGLYQQTPENYVMHGDCILLEISKDGLRRLKEEIQNRTDRLSRAAEGEFAAAGERSRVQTFNVDQKSGKRELH